MAAYLSDADLTLDGSGRFSFVLAAERPDSTRTGRFAVGGDSRGRLGDRGAPVPGPARGRDAGPLRHRAPRSPRPPARTDGRRARRPVHGHGLDHRQADHSAPDRPARVARCAQPAGDGRSRRPRGGEHHPGQPLHARHLPAGGGRGAPSRDRAARRPVLERHGGEHLARVHRAEPAAELAHQRHGHTGGGRDGHRAHRRRSPAPGTPGADNWLDTGGRHRGFVILRWLDNPRPPDVRCRVLSPGRELRAAGDAHPPA